MSDKLATFFVDPPLKAFFETLEPQDQFALLFHADKKDQIYQWMLNVMKLDNVNRLNAVDRRITLITTSLAQTSNEKIKEAHHKNLELLQKFRRYILNFFEEEGMFPPHCNVKF